MRVRVRVLTGVVVVVGTIELHHLCQGWGEGEGAG